MPTVLKFAATTAFGLLVLNAGPSSAQTLTLVPAGSVWKYLDNGSNQSTAWRATSFDDAGWAQGPAQLGYGDGGEATVVSYGPNSAAKYITTYFRRAFTVEDPSQLANALIEVVRDDGAVVYLNGVEVFRSNMPAGAIAYNSLSPVAVGGTDEERFFAGAVPASALLPGVNVLAVEVHQNAGNSSDIGFDLRLTAQPLTMSITPVAPAAGAVGVPVPATLSVTVQDPQADPLTVTFYGRTSPADPFTVVQTNPGVVSGGTTSATWNGLPAGQVCEWQAISSDGTNSVQSAILSFTTNQAPAADALTVETLPDTSLRLVLTGSDAESHFGILPDYTQQQYIGDLTAIVEGLSGATWNADTGTLFMIRNLSTGAGDSYEYTATGTHLRTIVQSGFQDTEAIAWMYGTTYAIAEENNFQRITICTIAPGATTLSRTAPGNVTWTTPVGNALNLGIESLCYDPDRDRLYYCAEKPSAGQWPIYSMDPATGVSTVLCDVNGSIATAGVATDLADMAYDRANRTLLFLSHESNKILRTDLTGTVLETKPFTGFTQAEALALSSDRRQLWVMGEPKQFARYQLPSNTLTYTIVELPQHGVLRGVPPTLDYVPDAGFEGTDSFTFAVNDGSATSTAVVSITVGSANQPPIAQSQTGALDEDTFVAITLTADDPDAQPLAFSVINGPQYGVLSGTAPNLIYTPASNYHGQDSFEFIASDGQATSAPATVSIVIRPINDAPLALPQAITLAEDTAQAISLTGADADGDNLSFTVIAPPAHGDLSGIAPNLTYLPSTNFSGSDAFTFIVDDGTESSAPQTISLTINAVNDAPVAAAQSLSGTEDQPLAVTLSASDVEGDVLTFSVQTSPAHGSISGTGPNLTYTPNADFAGEDSFTFSADDGMSLSGQAVVSIAVGAVNDVPRALAQSITTNEDSAAAIVLGGSDVENDPLGFEIVSQPSHGTLSGAPPNVTYNPNGDYVGEDNFTFTVNDGAASSAPATVSIAVLLANDAPTANPGSLLTDEDTAVQVTLTGSDANGDPLTYTVVTPPDHGLLSGTPPALLYTPDAHYHGPDSFAFVANDGRANSQPALVTITVASINDSPSAASQSLTTDEDTAAAIILAGNDSDGDALAYSLVNLPTHGSLSGNAPNLTYTPELNFNGEDSFTFETSDGESNSTSATITITVLPVNDPPRAVAQSIALAEDSSVAIILVGTDAENSPLTYSLVSGPVHGTLSGIPPNLTYLGSENFHGSDSISFLVNDGAVDSAVATVTLNISPLNDPPVAAPLDVTTLSGVPVEIILPGSDVDGDVLTFTVLAGPGFGSLSGPEGALIYTPNDGFSGSDQFTYEVSDGQATSASSAVTIQVEPPPWQLVVITGAVAPGVSGGTFTTLNSDFVSDGDGRAAFRATATASGTSSTGLWAEGPSGLEAIVLQGASAPGVTGAVFDPITVGPWSAGSGDLLVYGKMRAKTGGVTTSNDVAYWLRTNSGPLQLVARENSAVPGLPAAAKFNVINSTASLISAGKFAFTASLQTNSSLGITSANDTAVWANPSGTLTVFSREGTQAPGAAAGQQFDSFTSFGLIANEAGQFGFQGLLKLAAGVTSSTRYGIWLGDESQIGLVVRGGQAAPGTLGGTQFLQPQNSTLADGALAFSSTLAQGTGDATSSTDTGIWILENGAIGLAAREGFQAPGVPPGGKFTGITEGAAVNDSDEFVFRASLATGGGVTSSDNAGVWVRSRFTGPAVALSGRKNSAAPGAPGAVFTSFDVPLISPGGQEVFTATLLAGVGGVTTANDRGLWVRNALGELTLSLREGDSIELGPNEMRTVANITLSGLKAAGRHPWSREGRLLVLLTLNDGRTALLRHALP